MVMCHLGHWESAEKTLVSHDTYLRPGELEDLMWDNLVPPQPSLGAYANTWALVMHLQEAGVQSKAGIYDDGVIFDSPHMLWMNTLHARRHKTLHH